MTPDNQNDLETKNAIKVCLEFGKTVESYINKNDFSVGLGYKDEKFIFHIYFKNENDMSIKAIPTNYKGHSIVCSYVGTINYK